MRVAIVASGMSGPGSGSWNLMAARLRGLNSAGVEVVVQCTADQAAWLEGLPTFTTDVVRYPSKVHRMLHRGRDMARMVRRYQPHLVQIEAPPFVSVGSVPVLAVIHDLRFFETPALPGPRTEKIYQRYFLPRASRRVDAVLTLSPASRDAITHYLGVRPEGVWIVPPVLEEGVSTNRHERSEYVLLLGHLERRKNFELILRAAATAYWPEDLRVVIAGQDSGSLDVLRGMAQDCRCLVQFEGHVDENRKTELLRDSALVLAPSLHEGFGMVALEAAAVGTPFLVSGREPLQSLARSPLAVVSDDSPESWAQRVAHLYEDSSAWSQVAKDQRGLLDDFAEERIMPQLISVYDQVMRRHASARH